MSTKTKAGWSTRGLVLATLLAAASTNVVFGQQLPRSGSISFHTGWKYVADTVSASDKHVLGRGNATGTTFNDKAAGPLHLGPANCFEGFFVVDGKGSSKGYCAFGDPDGDRIFTAFSGSFGQEGANGTNEIIGGTGKYDGIQGRGPWKCSSTGNNGEIQCAQRLDYRLP
jgi:hypothetical protein